MKKVYFLALVMIFAAVIAGCKKGEEAPAASAANAPQAAAASEPSAVVDELKPTTDELIREARNNFEPIPLNVEEGYKLLKNNTPTTEKLELGKMLYFEPRLSKSQLISCNNKLLLAMAGREALEMLQQY